MSDFLTVGQLIEDLRKFPYYYRVNVGRYIRTGDIKESKIHKIVQGDPDHCVFQDVVYMIIKDD